MISKELSEVHKLIVVKRKVTIDSNIFKLHYNFVRGFLVAASILIATASLIGDPIHCFYEYVTPEEFIPYHASFTKAITTYCWVAGSFTIPNYTRSAIGTSLAHPGVGTHDVNDGIVYHNYYIWIPIVLFLQGMSFYIVHFIWKLTDAYRLENIICGLNNVHLPSEKINTVTDLMITHFSRIRKTKIPLFWFVIFCLCELLNLLTVALNMHFTDEFLGGEFRNYGIEVIQFLNIESENRTDAMAKVFPRVTKCNWYMFGTSGTVERHDAVCILAQNILNEKVYIIIWFLFIILLAINSLNIVFRIATIVFEKVRCWVLFSFGKVEKNKQQIEVLVRNTSVAEWFLISHIADNLDPLVYPVFIKKLNEHHKID